MSDPFHNNLPNEEGADSLGALQLPTKKKKKKKKKKPKLSLNNFLEDHKPRDDDNNSDEDVSSLVTDAAVGTPDPWSKPKARKKKKETIDPSILARAEATTKAAMKQQQVDDLAAQIIAQVMAQNAEKEKPPAKVKEEEKEKPELEEEIFPDPNIPDPKPEPPAVVEENLFPDDPMDNISYQKPEPTEMEEQIILEDNISDQGVDAGQIFDEYRDEELDPASAEEADPEHVQLAPLIPSASESVPDGDTRNNNGENGGGSCLSEMVISCCRWVCLWLWKFQRAIMLLFLIVAALLWVGSSWVNYNGDQHLTETNGSPQPEKRARFQWRG